MPDFSSFADSLNANSGNRGGGGGGGSDKPGTDSGSSNSYTSGTADTFDADGVKIDDFFNITINFSGSWAADVKQLVENAADLLSSIITSGLTDDTDPSNDQPVDDVTINMSTGRIADIPLLGNTLAQTAITSYRTENVGNPDEWLPVTADIKLDSSDIKDAKSNGWFGTWDDIILHEMVHAIGFVGFVFDGLKLVNNGNFVGANATAAYGGTAVPIESGGGSGTAGSHWDELDFAPHGTPMSNELMTGYVIQNEQTYLSDVTIGLLADIGYSVVDPSSKDAYLPVDLFA